MRIIAIDLGAARTGIAMSDLSGSLASPYTVIADPDMEKVFEKVVALMTEEKVTEAAVGYPRHVNGDEGDSALQTAAFAERLAARTGIPVKLWDERFSTVIAHQYYNDSGKKGALKRRKTIDSAAAAVILQSYLDFRHNTQENQ